MRSKKYKSSFVFKFIADELAPLISKTRFGNDSVPVWEPPCQEESVPSCCFLLFFQYTCIAKSRFYFLFLCLFFSGLSQKALLTSTINHLNFYLSKSGVFSLLLEPFFFFLLLFFFPPSPLALFPFPSFALPLESPSSSCT